MGKVKISGIGCTLIDYVYNGVSLTGPGIDPYLSREEGDGGISPGKLVFTEELERYSGESYKDILKKITKGRGPDAKNIGGPAIVSMIHVSQMLGEMSDIHFVGAAGNDITGTDLLNFLEKTPLDSGHLRFFNLPTPYTHVLSDPEYNNGEGERTFINNIGAANELKEPGPGFFDAGICVFGGTALVPEIHDKLDIFLRKAKEAGAFTVVNTVYDFRNQKKAPEAPWPLGSGHEAVKFIDLLIMDLEEALRISGKSNGDDAFDYFIEKGARGVVITQGAEDIRVYSSDEIYFESIKMKVPVSQKVKSDLKCSGINGDTTGCGDNFAGGMIFSLADQLNNSPEKKPDIIDMVLWGRASGGFACFYLGGTYFEESAGEKRVKVERYLD